MILARENDDTWIVVTQGDHARLAAQLLELWREPPIDTLPDHEELLFAVREHDNGWRELDAAPMLHPEGDRPHDFLTLPNAERREMWERGSARHEHDHPLAALLITEHALHLLDEAEPSDSDDSSQCTLHERRATLLEATGVCTDRLAGLYRWLALTDGLSLVACCRWEAPFERAGFAARWNDGTLGLEPFPLRGATTFALPVRRLARRPYRGAGDLGVALMTAHWQEIPVKVASLG